MENGFNTITGKGLGFFGKITASISHELKNSLAIINEKAGLLEDFALMAHKGVTLDPERMESLAGQIIKQIQRANDIIKTLNTFSHSAEEPLKKVDLVQILVLVIRLCSRFADMKSITIEPDIPAEPMPVETRPFFAEYLISHCLTKAMDMTGGDKKLQIGMERSDDGIRILIFPLEPVKQSDDDFLADKETKMLTDILHAQIEQNHASGKLSLLFPRTIPSDSSRG